MDITEVILHDHHEQRRMFAMLEQIEDSDVNALSAVWDALVDFLETHAEAEEVLFYPELLRRGRGAGGKPDAKAETTDAIKDHNEIRDAIAAVAREGIGSAEWRKAVAKVDRANGDHMAEEEREGLADFRRRASLELRHELAVRFVSFEARHRLGVPAVDKDPQSYVAEHR